jgi:glutamyl-tRNA reductase
MARQIFAAEISHEDTPLPIREKLAANEATVKQHLILLSNTVDEIFIVSTCNRFTLYAISDDITPLTRFFEQYPILKGYIQFYYNTEESITHLFAVASGLLSPIKGDHQILDELKRAHQWALECNTIGITLDNLLREAIRIGKKVRTETGIDKFCSSVVDAGIELLYNRMDGLHDKKILIVGTGKIARLALKYLYKEGVHNISIASHNVSRAEELADLYNARAVSIDDLHEHAKIADVVIGGTFQEVSLFSSSDLSGFFDHDKMWFILDFGMPRNFNSKLGDHKSIELYNLDDLKRLHKSPLDSFGGIEAAWTIVMREAKDIMEILLQIEYSPIMVAYWNRLLDVKNRKSNMLLPKLENKLTPLDVEHIKHQAKRIMRTISGDPRKNAHALTNNVRATGGRELIKDITSFKVVRINFSAN